MLSENLDSRDGFGVQDSVPPDPSLSSSRLRSSATTIVLSVGAAALACQTVRHSPSSSSSSVWTDPRHEISSPLGMTTTVGANSTLLAPLEDRAWRPWGSAGLDPSDTMFLATHPPDTVFQRRLKPARMIASVRKKDVASSAKKAQLAKARAKALPVAGGLAVPPLRLKLLRSLVTRALYIALASGFLARYQIRQSCSARLVDLALERELNKLYLEGQGLQTAINTYAAVKWLFAFTPQDLRLSLSARKGFNRTAPYKQGLPVVWEEVLLSSLALAKDKSVPPLERGATIVGNLTSFDCYGRSSDLSEALVTELRRPVMELPAQFRGWTLTLNPLDSEDQTFSKSGTIDDTIIVGGSNKTRRRIIKLLPALLGMKRSTLRLLDLTPKRYKQLTQKARELAKLDKAGAHQFRRGGASMDALEEATRDSDMLSRGWWKQLSSAMRYRKPAQYLRRLERLSPIQKTCAPRAPSELCRLVPRLLAGLSTQVIMTSLQPVSPYSLKLNVFHCL